MKIVDTNVLVYAVDTSSRHHRLAKHWLDGAMSGGAPVGFVWLAVVGFVRLVTNPSVMARPLPVPAAMDVVDAWMGARSAHILHPGRRHAALLRDLLTDGRAANVTNDAHLAAVAIEHRATVVSFDSDFGRFDGVRWERPS